MIKKWRRSALALETKKKESVVEEESKLKSKSERLLRRTARAFTGKLPQQNVEDKSRRRQGGYVAIHQPNTDHRSGTLW